MEQIPNEWLQEEPQAVLTRAHDLLTKGGPQEIRQARTLCEVVFSIDRANAGIAYLIGTSYMAESRWGFAETWFRRSLEMQQDFAPTWNNLGFLLQQEGRFNEAKAAFEKAIELSPDQTEFANNMATLFVNNGTPEEAIDRCQRALDLDPDNPDARWNMALAQLELGQWKEGWQNYRAGMHSKKTSSQKRKLRVYPSKPDLPYWDGTPGKTVVIYGEQGVGDEILAASMLDDASKDIKIIYEAHPRLVDIMRRSFGDKFPIYGTRKTDPKELAWLGWTPDLDAKLPILGLGEFYRNRDEDFPRKPYLAGHGPTIEKYREKLAAMGRRPKIGLSWKGGSVITRHDLRSIPLDRWVPLLKSVDVDWVSLQYDHADHFGWNTPIVEKFESDTGIKLNHWPEVINDLDECYGGLIHALDLVISVNTSLVHACGAFGVPCWVLTPSRPAWRYQVKGEKMIWYGDHVRQIRQEKDDWGPVLERVQMELGQWLEEVTAA